MFFVIIYYNKIKGKFETVVRHTGMDIMPIRDILIRSLSGYVFVVPGILLYFLYLRKSGKKQTPLHIAAVLIFCYYLIGILTMTGIGKLESFEPRIVLIPFLDMISGPIDTLLNVVLFVPLGFFLPFLWERWEHIGSVALTGFLFSLSIEIVQMFGHGATDINDLITNTVGACLGYLIYKLLSKLIPKEWCRMFQSNGTKAIIDVVFFIVYSFVVMVTIQPFIISSLFSLA